MEPKYVRGEQGVRDLEFVINEEREALNKFFKKFKLVNFIVLITTLVVVTVSFVVLFPLGNLGLTLGLVLSVFFLVGSMVYMRIMKNHITKKGNRYIAKFYEETSDFIFNDLALVNYRQEVNNILMTEHFVDAKLIKDITASGSRNLVKYNLGKYNISLADYAAYKSEGKQNKIVFAGKLFVVDNIKPLEGRVLIYRRPDSGQVTNAAGPDDIEGLTLVKETDDVLIYAEKEEDIKTLGKDFIENVSSFPRELPFVDMSLSFIGERLTIAVSYDDILMGIPLPLPFEAKPTENFKRDLEEINKLIELL